MIPNETNLDWFIKYQDPENEYFIVHSIEGDTMIVADEEGDFWPYIRNRGYWMD